MEWSEVEASAALHGTLPATPVLLRGSPMQAWHAAHGDAWAVETVAALAAGTHAGDYNVTWLSQNQSRTFLNHNRQRYDAYSFPQHGEGATPRHQRRAAPLRNALRELWRDEASASDNVSHYVTAFVDDFVPSLAKTLMEWLPAGCLRDDRFDAASDWDESIADYSTLANCRDLNSVVWFGAADVRVSTHYDISHNLFFQLDGKKRFDLLPPSAHAALRLYPFWHGSNRQAQAALPLSPEQPMWRADLEPGDALLLPSRWFHSVTSMSRSIGVNWWTGGLDRDVWIYVLGADGDEDGWDGGTRWSALACAGPLLDSSVSPRLPLLDCARDSLAAVLAALEHGTPDPLLGGRPLSRRAKALLRARYEPIEPPLPPTAVAASVAEHCQRRSRRGEEAKDDEEATGHSLPLGGDWMVAVRNSARALGLLSESNLDLALDDLLDHTAAWAVGQAVPNGADGSAVQAFLTHCT